MSLRAISTVLGPAAVLGRLACLEEDVALLGRQGTQVKRAGLQDISHCHTREVTVHSSTVLTYSRFGSLGVKVAFIIIVIFCALHFCLLSGSLGLVRTWASHKRLSIYLDSLCAT